MFEDNKRKYSLGRVIALMLLSAVVAITTAAVVLRFIIGGDIAVETIKYVALQREVERNYIGEYDGKAAGDEAMKAYVAALGDRWSYYMTFGELGEYTNSSNNSFAGIGVSIELVENSGGARITYIYPGGGAEEAGIVVGDIITAVDEESILGFDTSTVSELIRREIGQQVVLTVLREDGSSEDISVAIRTIFTDPVSYSMLDNNVGYVKIKNFEAGSAESFSKAIVALLEEGAEAFIYDLRNNGGGKVSELTKMLDELLPECEIFVSIDSAGNEKVTQSGATMTADVPTVVLVNRNTFSAAEYFAATLREYGRADIVGEHTSGKNRSQTTYRIPFGGALHISSAQYLTPSRVSLYDEGGIAPDEDVPVTDDEFVLLFYGRLPQEDDPQLGAALEMLK